MKKDPEQIVKKVDFLKGERHNWETQWQEVAEFVVPRKDSITKNRVKGEKVNQFLLDNTALQSNVLLSGFLHGLLTNPNSQFFELTTGVRDIDDRDDVRKWLQRTSTSMHNVLNASNFQTEIHELYIDLGSFGTAAMSIEEDEESVVRFSARPIESIFVEEDNRGQIMSTYRQFKWNLTQIMQEFGEDVINKSKQLQSAHGRKDDSKEFEIIHAVYPDDISVEKSTKRFKYISQYILKSDKVELRVSGFSSFPFVVPRWTKTSSEKYGRSPGMNALPEAKTLNLMAETTIKGAQKVVEPASSSPGRWIYWFNQNAPWCSEFLSIGLQ